MSGDTLKLLMDLAGDNTWGGFKLAKLLLDLSEDDRERFWDCWIESERQKGAPSLSDLENLRQAEDDYFVEQSQRKKAEEAAANLSIIGEQIADTDIVLERESWNFTLFIPSLGKFKFPYVAIATSVCNRLIQYEATR